MNSTLSTEGQGDICLDALHVIDRHLATIKGRVEILLLAGCPEYIQSDLTTVYNAEQEISQIVRSLTVSILNSTNQLQEGNSL